MVHRDIKPANIMLDKRIANSRLPGEPVLMDFGIAKLQGGAADATKVLGTPLYISPEQAQGLSGDQRSDLYSLGIILYEIATGVTPFRNASLVALLMQHYQDMPPPPALINPDIAPALSAVILKSIAKNPDDRFLSASAMTIAVAEALNVPVPSALRQATAKSVSLNDHNPLLRPAETVPAITALPSLPDEQLPTLISAHNNATLYMSSSLDKSTLLSGEPQTPPLIPVPRQTRKRAGKLLTIASIALLVVLGLGIAAFFALRNTGTPPPVSSAVVGQIVFLSSQGTSGSLDMVQMNLHSLQETQQDRLYYAWLETHEDSTVALSWSFTNHNGTPSPASYTQPQHQNLLTHFPYLFLITSQSARTDVPSFDPKDHLYYASIPQKRSTVDNLSLVDHLNRLLTNDPRLEQLTMSDGLRYWLVQNSQALAQEADAARTAWQGKQVTSLRQHLVNSVYYLDGTSCAPSDLQVPPQGTPTTPNVTLTHAVSASLLNCSRNSVLTGLLAAIGAEVHGLTQAPGATQYQTTLAAHIQTALTAIQNQLKRLQQETLQLLLTPDAQLFQASAHTLLNQIVTDAHDAYSGQTTPAQAGIEQVGGDIGHLASFDVLPCPQGSSGNICLS
jgi:serine/threonine protein kinase